MQLANGPKNRKRHLLQYESFHPFSAKYIATVDHCLFQTVTSPNDFSLHSTFNSPPACQSGVAISALASAFCKIISKSSCWQCAGLWVCSRNYCLKSLTAPFCSSDSVNFLFDHFHKIRTVITSRISFLTYFYRICRSLSASNALPINQMDNFLRTY